MKRIFYAVAGAFVTYLYKNNTEQQFRDIVKNQTISSARKIYGEKFDSMIAEFNGMLGLKN